jgi:hypothetical protein
MTTGLWERGDREEGQVLCTASDKDAGHYARKSERERWLEACKGCFFLAISRNGTIAFLQTAVW